MIDVRTFRARNMEEALAQVRRELGSDAVIFHSRELKRNLLHRLVPYRPRVEVTAGTGMSVRTANGPFRSKQEPSSSDQAIMTEHLQGQLHRLSGMLEQVVHRSRHQHVAQLPDHVLALYAELVETEVPEDLARELIYKLHDEWTGAGPANIPQLRAHLIEMIAAEFQIKGAIQTVPGQRKIITMVGPTGVGKTTTIAKLAANFRLRERQRVGLITVDTYRVAAVEHLRAYAEIIDLPMKVVMNARDMKWALSELSDMYLILIDTAGRSPREELKIQELKTLLQEAHTDEINLVLCASASLKSLTVTAEKFAGLGLSSLLLTKLDETAGMGNLLALARATQLPLSYLTTGQNVPDDIETADPGRLSRLILGQEPLRV